MINHISQIYKSKLMVDTHYDEIFPKKVKITSTVCDFIKKNNYSGTIKKIEKNNISNIEISTK